MKTTVIHHSADYDGLFCREIAKHFLGTDGITYIGWDFNDPKIPLPEEGIVLILDLSPECLDLDWTVVVNLDRLVWIDHHKTAIDKFSSNIRGYRIDGVAACRLLWQWFYLEGVPDTIWPDKTGYVERRVREPLAVRLAGEYDVWDHRGDGDLEFQFGLRSEKNLNWEWLFDTTSAGCESYTRQLIAQGNLIMDYSAKVDAGTVNGRSFMLEFEGLRFLTLNTARCNSLTFAAKDVPETGHDALMAFYFNGRQWTFSLYHASHRKDLDLSAIAVKYKGGGHRGACGFTSPELPFLIAHLQPARAGYEGRKLTIAELEQILSESNDSYRINLKPDGSIEAIRIPTPMPLKDMPTCE